MRYHRDSESENERNYCDEDKDEEDEDGEDDPDDDSTPARAKTKLEKIAVGDKEWTPKSQDCLNCGETFAVTQNERGGGTWHPGTLPKLLGWLSLVLTAVKVTEKLTRTLHSETTTPVSIHTITWCRMMEQQRASGGIAAMRMTAVASEQNTNQNSTSSSSHCQAPRLSQRTETQRITFNISLILFGR